MFSRLLIVTTAAILAVNAQGTSSSSAIAVPSGLPGITPCILACVQPAASQNGCSSFADIQCVCTSAQFQSDVAACLQQHCSSADLQAALGLQSAECAAASLSATGSVAPKSVSFTLSSSAAASSTTTGAASVTTSAKGSSTVTTPNSSATGSSTTGTSSSSSSASPAASSAAASSLVANSGVGAIVAMIAGFLAI